MRFDLTKEEVRLLQAKGIPFAETHEYTDDEALDLLEQVRDVEVSYAQFAGGVGESLFFRYGDLADKIQAQIPED